MDLRKVQEHLEDLVENNYSTFVNNASTSDYPTQIIGEVFNDTTWDNLLEEPCLQIIFTMSDYEDYDQWFLTENGFSLDEIGMPDFAHRYGLTPRDEKELFEMYIKTFLKESTRRCPPEMFENMIGAMVDLMVEEDYFNRNYKPEELLEIYEMTLREEILPQTAKDVFLF